MTKRQHSEVSEYTSARNGEGADLGHSPKRSKTKGTSKQLKRGVATLFAHSDELIECIQHLKKGDILKHEASSERLAELSRTLLPAFQALGNPNQECVSESEAEQDTLSPANTSNNAGSAHMQRIPPLGPLTAFTLSDIPKARPPLPSISDVILEKGALTHHGARLTSREMSYENLEFLGDAFIYHVASEFLSQTFSDLMPGRLSQLRERLVRNSNLAQYSRHYGLDKRAALPGEFRREGRENGTKASEKERQKVYGDIFEAYVGALIRSGPDGVDRTLRWLKPLWALTLEDDIRKELQRQEKAAAAAVPVSGAANNSHTHQPTQKTPKVQLAALIGFSGVEITYKDMPGKAKTDSKNNLPLYTVGVSVVGWGKTTLLGHGSGLSKKDAGNKAAEEALKNKKAIKFYVDKKKAHLAAKISQEEEARV